MEPGLLADLAVAVADGTPVDWDAVESSAMTPTQRRSSRSCARWPPYGPWPEHRHPR